MSSSRLFAVAAAALLVAVLANAETSGTDVPTAKSAASSDSEQATRRYLINVTGMT